MEQSCYSIRQRFGLGESGDRAVVERIVRSGGKLYVEVSQTSDAREPTIMLAVNKALEEYERQTGVEVVDGDGQEEP